MKYEMMMILDPKKTDKETEKLLEEIKEHVTSNGFTMLDEDIWGTRQLAYKIKGYSTGYYVVWLFEGEGAGTVQLNKDLNIQAGLIRFLLVKVEDDHALMRYEAPEMPGSAQKLNKNAEELSKKITKKTTKKAEEAPKKEATEEDKKKLDDQLKAIMDDTDLNI